MSSRVPYFETSSLTGAIDRLFAICNEYDYEITTTSNENDNVEIVEKTITLPEAHADNVFQSKLIFCHNKRADTFRIQTRYRMNGSDIFTQSCNLTDLTSAMRCVSKFITMLFNFMRFADIATLIKNNFDSGVLNISVSPLDRHSISVTIQNPAHHHVLSCCYQLEHSGGLVANDILVMLSGDGSRERFRQNCDPDFDVSQPGFKIQFLETWDYFERTQYVARVILAYFD